MSRRMDKIEELIKREVSQELFFRFSDNFITVTSVEVATDLATAKIWLHALRDTDKVVSECQKEAKEITYALSQRIELRRFPRIRFLADHSPEKVEHIENLINEIKKSEKD